jgi:hypothetical protein
MQNSSHTNCPNDSDIATIPEKKVVVFCFARINQNIRVVLRHKMAHSCAMMSEDKCHVDEN